MNNYLLSIVAPIKNEKKYIEKLISTFLEIDDERAVFERWWIYDYELLRVNARTT